MYNEKQENSYFLFGKYEEEFENVLPYYNLLYPNNNA